MELYLTAFKQWKYLSTVDFKVMDVMGICVCYQFHERGCIKCNIFLISKGNKTNFTHIIVDYMGKQNVES